MIIIKIEESGSLEKALKKYKRKVDKVKQVRELRDRQTFEKPSVKKREKKKKAIYITEKERQENLD
jgi:small subunit ribosomal protein S21